MKHIVKLIFLLLLALILSSSKPAIELQLPVDIRNGQVVGAVAAADQDQGQTLTYEIVSGNKSFSFRLDPVTGVITVRNAAYIRSRAERYFDLVIKVTDSGGYDRNGKFVRLSSQATVRITK